MKKRGKEQIERLKKQGFISQDAYESIKGELDGILEEEVDSSKNELRQLIKNEFSPKDDELFNSFLAALLLKFQ